MEHECSIGMLSHVEHGEVSTVSDIQKYVELQKEMVEIDKSIYPNGSRFKWNTDITIYFDKRRSCNLERFNFCPHCGNKIDWKGLREKYGKEN